MAHPETNGHADHTGKKADATVWELATIIANSRDFPTARTPEKAAVRVLAGREMGVGPIASVIGIRVEGGRVSMDATLMAGCIHRSDRYRYKIETHTENGCVLVFSEKIDGEWKYVGKSEFNHLDAEKAGLSKKDTWRAYPRNMHFARALSNGARWYCPGIFGGSIYTHEEVGLPVNEQGEIADGSEGGVSAGGDLCSREQRAKIRSRLGVIGGISEKDFCGSLGIKMLDELSSYEADKQIKALDKKVAKAGQQQPLATAQPKDASPAVKNAGISQINDFLESVQSNATPAQESLIQAVQESQKPSTPEQHQRIFNAAEKLEPNEHACREMLRRWLAKRQAAKYRDLSFGQAEALIEVAEKAVADRQPPFTPTA